MTSTFTSYIKPPKPKTYYGYLCGTSYTDYDGSHETAEWIEPAKHDGEPDPYRAPDSLGWYVDCQCEPEAGIIGPFDTEERALQVSTDDNEFWKWQNEAVEEHSR